MTQTAPIRMTIHGFIYELIYEADNPWNQWQWRLING